MLGTHSVEAVETTEGPSGGSFFFSEDTDGEAPEGVAWMSRGVLERPRRRPILHRCPTPSVQSVCPEMFVKRKYLALGQDEAASQLVAVAGGMVQRRVA